MQTWATTRHNNGEVRRFRRSERHVAGEPTGVVTTARMARANTKQEKPESVGARVAARSQRTSREGATGRPGGGWAHSTGDVGQRRRREGALIESKRNK